MAEGYHKYISRCQYVLSQGSAVADILYLNPEGAPQVFLPPSSALEGTSVLPDKRGYSFDGCSPLFLIANASVKEGRIVFPGGGSYHILVLPQVETMTPGLVTKIGSLIKDGATIIGNPPYKSPSLVNYPECDQQVKALADNIWGKGAVPKGLVQQECGLGKIWWGNNLQKQLSINSTRKDSLSLYPDYQATIAILSNTGIGADFISSGNIRYTHRSLADRDIYFISNRTGMAVSDTCIFRDGTMNAELWDPVTGETESIDCFTKTDGAIAVKVNLEAFQSFFIVFYHQQKPVNDRITYSRKFQEKQPLFTFKGSWNVAFDTVWGGPSEVIFDSLSDWSERKEDGIKYYSGIAVYKKIFDMPESAEVTDKVEYFLDLGILKNLGRVKLNGKDLGIIWTAPWQVNITDVLKMKGNRLEIEVANLWINRLIGDESLPWDGVEDGKWPDWLINGTQRESNRYTFTTHRFYKKGDQLTESGLIGPVSIKMIKKSP
jgi:hypothetical protein